MSLPLLSSRIAPIQKNLIKPSFKTLIRFQSAVSKDSSVKSSDEKFTEIATGIQNFIDFNKTPTKLRPFVYREKNHKTLLTYDLRDKEGKKILPKSRPSLPSKQNLYNLIENLKDAEGLNSLLGLMFEISKINTIFIDDKIISELLYKSAKIDQLSITMKFIKKINTASVYKKSNTHFVKFTPSLVRTMGILTFLKYKNKGYAPLDKLKQSFTSLQAVSGAAESHVDYLFYLTKVGTWITGYKNFNGDAKEYLDMIKLYQEKLSKVERPYTAESIKKDTESLLPFKKQIYFQKHKNDFVVFRTLSENLEIPNEFKELLGDKTYVDSVTSAINEFAKEAGKPEWFDFTSEFKFGQSKASAESSTEPVEVETSA